MQKRLKLFTPIIILLMALCAMLVALTILSGDLRLFFTGAALSFVVFLIVLILLRRANRQTGSLLEDISESIRYTLGQDYAAFPVPVVTAYAGGEIIWYNDLCRDIVFAGQDLHGEDISEVLSGLDLNVAAAAGRADVTCADKAYTAYVTQRGESSTHILYLIDDTELKYYTSEYHLSKPSIALISVDNYEELMQDYKDSERAQLMGDIERVIEDYIAANCGFVTKIARDKFIAFIEERGFESIISGKFEILDRVRAIQFNQRMNATLSIGVGREADNLFESDAMARQALDMCLGRGGDQAAIKTQTGYEFYGGVSKAIEKRTKVKTRIIANALSEMIESSSNIIIMGHRFADLDCLGSAVGLLKAVKSMGKPGVIAIDQERNLVQPLLEKLFAAGYGQNDFYAPDDAFELVENGTLLIIVDTHVPNVLESEGLYRACKNVVVIDHHRRLVGHIDNAVIFYHEPYASSASEMIAELVQYFPSHPQMTRIEAEAMMSGIMLDTKNFVMRTGVRTFEAAAWLRRLGADTLEVRKFFSSSMDAYQQKAALVSTAVVHKGCAIAMCEHQFEGIRVVAPQAADEMMTISGVDASFIIYPYGNVVNVSARSMGNFNVQVLMEKLGGGGHQTMAAAQFPNEELEIVREMLVRGIDDFYEEQALHRRQMENRTVAESVLPQQNGNGHQ